MKLEDSLKHMSWDARQKAIARADYMSKADWFGLAEHVINELKKIDKVTLIAIKLDHIEGLKIRVICEAGAFSDIHGDVTRVEMGVFDKYLNTWGNFRTYDERGVDFAEFSDYYIVPVK